MLRKGTKFGELAQEQKSYKQETKLWVESPPPPPPKYGHGLRID